MMDWAAMAMIAAAFFVVAASPGPATLANASVAMAHGRSGGLRFGLGLALGLAFWGIVAATGLGAVLQSSVIALSILKTLGGAYLLWLAWQSGRAALCRPAEDVPSAAAGRWFLRGLVLNLSNPKAVVAWMAALSMGLDPGDGLRMVAMATVMCCAIGLAIYAVIAVMFSLERVMATYRRFRHWVDGAVAGLFAIAGVGLIRSALSR